MTDRGEIDEKPLAIVVGVDGSDSSKAALRWADRQAGLTGAPLRIISTWHRPTDYGWAAPWPADVEFEAAARYALDDSAGVLGADRRTDVSMTALEGHPAATLVEQSRSASLIVVGSRGHGEFAGMLLGSVSEFLVTHAHCPVVVVRGADAKDS